MSNSKNSIEYKLGLKISESILLLENEKNYLLDIKSIKANKNLYEIRIKSPLNYRIFYYDNNGKLYIVLDIIEKKTNKLPQKYFDDILKRIERNL
ncbi:type II toxin-antitoxin system RelE/ParE family toxin [Fusobacterium nucleatum]|uniref:type II toxin-antitoxin system RelE/ParE family toxin n=1 Tax=Fusobacterium nucleatum subsp. polymorphum TaxID=76857 RepID=UPI00164D2F11|nr:type II toxin-antitoxin system RelE/ParE family toxin [Fusobacterium polymorphum]